MREIRLFVSVLFLLILTVSFIGCSKTEDEEQETSTVAAQATAPAEHEVVSTVREFLKAIEGGDYDRAIELGTPMSSREKGLSRPMKPLISTMQKSLRRMLAMKMQQYLRIRFLHLQQQCNLAIRW